MDSNTDHHLPVASSLPLPEHEQIARSILRIIYRQRRLTEEHDRCLMFPCKVCLQLHIHKIVTSMEQGAPIRFILPAFPAKSPNLSKVLGSAPDLGEHLSLQQLNELCLKITAVYPPGANIIICSDGRAFSDCVGVSDEEVTHYGQAIRHILDEHRLDNIQLFNLEDYFNSYNFERIRQQLVERYGRPLEALKAAVKTDPETANLFNGIHRFMFTDLKFRKPDCSKNKLKEESKALAYQVIIRSNAWSALVEEVFPEAIRLSIHPQPPHSKKIGIKLMECDNIWRTPWHGAVLDDGQKYRLMSRADIEKLPVNLVYQNGRPFYYVLRRYANAQPAQASED